MPSYRWHGINKPLTCLLKNWSNMRVSVQPITRMGCSCRNNFHLSNTQASTTAKATNSCNNFTPFPNASSKCKTLNDRNKKYSAYFINLFDPPFNAIKWPSVCDVVHQDNTLHADMLTCQVTVYAQQYVMHFIHYDHYKQLQNECNMATIRLWSVITSMSCCKYERGSVP